MSFLRALFESRPEQTDEEYAATLIDEISRGENVDHGIVHLKDLSKTCCQVITEKGIPAIVSTLKSEISEETASNLYFIINDLMASTSPVRGEAAEAFVKDISVFVDALSSENEKKRVASMHIAMKIAVLAPDLTRSQLLVNEATLTRLLACVSDVNESISGCLVDHLPQLLSNDTEFKSVVSFYALDGLMKRIERVQYLHCVLTVLDGNPIGQNMFISEGYINWLESLLRRGNEEAIRLIEMLRGVRGFAQALRETTVISILVDVLFDFPESSVHDLLVELLKGGGCEISQAVTENLGRLLKRYVGDESFPLIEILSAYLFESNENGISLANAIVELKDYCGDVIDIATLCVLVVESSKKVFEDFFDVVVSQVNPNDFSGFRFLVTMVWNSGEFMEKLKSSGLLARIVSFLVGGMAVGSDVLPLMYFLLAEVALSPEGGRVEFGVFEANVATEKLLLKLKGTEANEGLRFGKLQRNILDSLADLRDERSRVVNQGTMDKLTQHVQLLTKQLKAMESEKNETENRESRTLTQLEDVKNELENVKNDNVRLAEQYTKEIEEIRADNTRLRSEIESLSEKHKKELDEEKSETAKSSEQYTKEIEEIRADNTRLRSEIESLSEKHKKELDEEKVANAVSVAQRTALCNELKKQLDDFKNENRRLTGELESLSIAYRKQLDDLKNENAELSTARHALCEEMENMQRKYSKLAEEKENLAVKCRKHAITIQELNSLSEEYRKQLTQAKEDQETIKILEISNKELREECDRVKTKTELETAKNEAAKLTNEKEALSAKYSSMSQEILSSTERVRLEKEKEIQEFAIRVSDLEKSVSQSNREKQELAVALERKDQIIARLELEIETHKEAAKTDNREAIHQHMLDSRVAEITMLQTELIAARQANAQAQKKIESIGKEKRKLTQSLSILKHKKKEEVVTATHENQTLTREVDKIAGELMETRDLASKQRLALLELETIRDQQEKTIASLKDENNQLREKASKQGMLMKRQIVLTDTKQIVNIPATKLSSGALSLQEKQARVATIRHLKKKRNRAQTGLVSPESEKAQEHPGACPGNKILEASLGEVEQSNISTARDEIEHEDSHLKRTMETLREREQVITQLTEEKQQLNAQLLSLTESSEKLQKVLGERIEELKHERAVAKTRHMTEIGTLESKIKMLKQRNKELVELAQGDQTSVGELREIITALKSEISTMRSENAKLVRYVQTIRPNTKRNADDTVSEVTHLKEQNKKLLRQNAELSAELRVVNELFQSQSRQISELKSRISDDETAVLRNENAKIRSKFEKRKTPVMSAVQSMEASHSVITEEDHKKALRLIGRMWLSKHYQSIPEATSRL